MSPGTGRREANKQATKAALRQAATRLFAEQGYEATTVAEIARTAQVGERTFYRYFGGKEELLAEQALAWIDTVHDAIRDRPANETPFQAVARAMITVSARLAVGSGTGEAWILSDAPQPLALLRQAMPRPLRRLEQSIADAVRHRPGGLPGPAGQPEAPAAEFEAQLLARVAVAALRTAAFCHRQHTRDGTRSPGFEGLLRDAFDRLAGLARG